MLDGLRNDAMERVPDTIDEIAEEVEPLALDRLVRQLCDDFEVLAVGSLLLDAKPESFFLNLCRAAENWKRYLEHRSLMKWSPAPATLLSPLVGAVVASQWQLMAKLAELASAGGKREGDYDDEYLYARLVIELIKAGGRRAPQVNLAAAALAEADGGLFAGRLAVIQALLSGDADALQKSFADAVADYDNTIQEQAKMITIDPRKLEPKKYIWLEGLAFLRLAELTGMKITDQYLYCPPLARSVLTRPYAGDWVATFRR
jgi:hypothetical protein